MAPNRVDQWQAHLTVAGQDCGVWMTHSGGGVDSEEAFVREAYGLPRIALGGAPTVENVELERVYRTERDAPLLPFLVSQAGRGQCVISQQALDGDGFAVGKPITRAGILKAVTPPDSDVQGSDPAMLAVEISAHGVLVA
ncbi:MAG: hypothetical protein LC798_15580 [Chloroflexi bacterium]|nr:hypothetical protein [Chloroflexota bacterium]